jgi:RHS repeat-associated protein
MRGEPYQFFLNTPWGDQAFKKSLVGFFSAGAGLPRGPENQYAKSYTSFSSRFRFNGKEWDEETGNYYYGARYYDPKISVWLSVDPLAHKYPHVSPYNFVENNSLMLVDPTGMGPEDPNGPTHKLLDRQTLYGLANRIYKDQNITVEQLKEWNNIETEEGVRDIAIGTEILLYDPNQQSGTSEDQTTSESKADEEGNVTSTITKIGVGMVNSVYTTLSAIGQPIRAAVSSDPFMNPNPYRLTEDFKNEQIQGSTQDVAIEVMKSTIGLIFMGFPTTLPQPTYFLEEQIITSAAGEGVNKVIDSTVK